VSFFFSGLPFVRFRPCCPQMNLPSVSLFLAPIFCCAVEQVTPIFLLISSSFHLLPFFPPAQPFCPLFVTPFPPFWHPFFPCIAFPRTPGFPLCDLFFCLPLGLFFWVLVDGHQPSPVASGFPPGALFFPKSFFNPLPEPCPDVPYLGNLFLHEPLLPGVFTSQGGLYGLFLMFCFFFRLHFFSPFPD